MDMELVGDIHCEKPHFVTLGFFFVLFWQTIFVIDTCTMFFFNHFIKVKLKTLLTGKLNQFSPRYLQVHVY